MTDPMSGDLSISTWEVPVRVSSTLHRWIREQLGGGCAVEEVCEDRALLSVHSHPGKLPGYGNHRVAVIG